ncbi:MFS transporter [Ochrobactrum haematophilum]|uniref:MFS transporter n=1 Tax=Brucella haematophila TaxID=419474 RepID=A0ABX1DTN4_9HYPH|nr:MFS transporter [Brucella haematophila]
MRNTQFFTLWAAVELSFLGMFIHVVAGGWLMTALTPSAALVSLIQTAYALPMVAFSVVAGAMADTFDRRITMIISLAISLLASVGLAFFSVTSMLTPWSILALIFAVGSGVAIFTPSWQSSLGDIVPRERLVEAVSLHNIGANVMRTVGPSIGGILVASAGAGITFMVGAVSYLPALIVMFFRSPVQAKSNDREGFRSALVLGFRFLAVSQPLQILLLRVFCFSLAAICVMAMLPLVARDQFGQGALTYGFLFGGYGFGAILGGLCMKYLRRRFTVDHIVCSAFLMSAVAMALLAISRNLWGGLPSTVLGGACWLTVHSLQNSVLQLSSPRWIAGRMVAMFLSSAFLGLSIGGWLWGVVAEHFRTEGALGGATVLMLGAFALAVKFPLPDTTGINHDPLGTTELADEQNMTSHGGPLHVVIEHQIDAGHVSTFMALMETRRRHLTRLGATHWVLLRDLRRTGRWTESFQTNSWTDYRRMMSRRTSETAALRQQVIDLQLENAEPVVHLMLQTRVPRQAGTMLRA